MKLIDLFSDLCTQFVVVVVVDFAICIQLLEKRFFSVVQTNDL